MYTRVFLRLEPLGLELVAQAMRQAGHDVRLLDLQVEPQRRYFRVLDSWRPQVVAFSFNYLANLPEIVDLAKATKRRLPGTFVFVGGHSASFTARELLAHSDGAIDCVLRGEAEASVAALLQAVAEDRQALDQVPGAVTPDGEGPPPRLVESLDDLLPARDLLRHRSRYFIGVLDPCASIEFTRGCPWDCAFCSAWTFYGRSYRAMSPERVVEDLARIREPGVFIVDDVAFVHPEQGFAIGEAMARRNIRKAFYLETRGDVLLRNKEVFALWKRLGVRYMFIGLEAIDEDGLARFRKRVPLGHNFAALEFARSLGIKVAVNIIADPDWDHDRFKVVREWCLEIPEIVNISVNTPYPGTESWLMEPRPLITHDYRLFDIQHAVLPTRLPLAEFYRELVSTQQVLNRKHLGWRALKSTAGIASGHLLRGQTNFVRMLWRFNEVYDPEKLAADHARPVTYAMTRPAARGPLDPRSLYVHQAKRRRDRAVDAETERFVAATRT